MKKYSHAWLAFKAIERLENSLDKLDDNNRRYAQSLIDWFMDHKDGVIQGAWYPDDVIKDMASSHVLKFTPIDGDNGRFRKLPNDNLMYNHGRNSVLFGKAYEVNENTNLPDRCESIAHSVIDNLKMQEKEPKGSPISPTDNHVATLLFMLSHYVADAHMPFHCDSRPFSSGKNIHTKVEKKWDDEIKKYYRLDKKHKRFFYNSKGYPYFKNEDDDYNESYLSEVATKMENRDFIIDWGVNNNNVWDYMKAICQYSYLVSYDFIPADYDDENDDWENLPNQVLNFEKMSVYVLSDAIDSIAQIWFRIWRKYKKWEDKQRD